MAYMEKTQRVHASFIHDLLNERPEKVNDRTCGFTPADRNVADLITNNLDKVAFERALKLMNVKTLRQFRDGDTQIDAAAKYAMVLATKITGADGAVRIRISSETHESDPDENDRPDSEGDM